MKKISLNSWNKKGSSKLHKNEVGSVEIITEDNFIIVDNFEGVGTYMKQLDEPIIKIIIGGRVYQFANFAELQTQLNK